MNSLALRAVLPALRAHVGSRVDDVRASDAWEFRLDLENGGTLVLSVHPEHNSLYPRMEDPRDETTDRRFVTILHTHLVGGRLAGVEQAGLDRVVTMLFRARDRLGDPRPLQLVAELTGKGANLMLVAGDEPFTGKIVDRMRTDRSRSGHRRVSAGAPYVLPESNRAPAERDALVAAVDRWRAEKASEAGPPLSELWDGVSPGVNRRIRERAGSIDAGSLADAWLAILDEARPPEAGAKPGPEFAPCVLRDAGGWAEAYPFPVDPEEQNRPAQVELTQSDTMADALFEAHLHFRRTHRSGQNSALSHAVRRALRKAERTLEALRREGSGGGGRDPEELRRQGEALLAAAHLVPKGAKTADIPDPEGGEPLTVKLNPALTASENAELFFKKARKAGRAGGAIANRGNTVRTQLRALEALSQELQDLGDKPAPEDWLRRARAMSVPLPREEAERVAGNAPEDALGSLLKPRTYDLGGGWELLVGKNDRSNHVLTFELAKPHDTWMHAEGCPGSHVVLRHPERDREPPRDVLLTAAAAAAFHSKARNSAKVPVTVASKRHVRRPRKAPVGQALVGEHRTIIVVPLNPDGR